MSPFDPDKYASAGSKFDPDAYASAPPENEERPGLAKRLYEQNVVIPVRAARHFAPNPEAIQERFIDPAIGYFTGETPEQRKANREEYDRYLQRQYPQAREFYESRGALVGGLAKGALAAVNPLMAAQQATEPLVEQIVTRPESVDFNPETAMSTANLLVPAALSAPKYAAKGIAGIKVAPAQKASLEAYRANPERFDIAEQRAGGEPIRSLKEEMYSNLQSKEMERAGKMGQLTAETAALKAEDSRQVARAIEDVRTKTELGTYEGDAMKSAVKKLRDNYEATAETRNKVLDETHGQMGIDPLLKLVDQAEGRVILPEHKANIAAVRNKITEMAGDSGQLSPRQINELRKNLQDNVSWGGHSQPWETQYKGLARDFNEILDMSIPDNHQLRSQIREETLRHNMANDLFGGDFPLKKFEAAVKDPMKRRELTNLNIPEIDDVIKTIDYRTNFNKNLKLGEKPKSEVIGEYLTKKKELEDLSANPLPLSSKQVGGTTLESAMMDTYRSPKLNAPKAIQGYAEKVHPQGSEDFYNKFEEAKVLRDVTGMDAAQGSRMTNIGRGVGAAIGGVGSYLSGNPVMSAQTGLAAGLGGLAGGYLDYNASSLFRSAARGAKATEPMSQAFYPFAGMSRQQAVEHFLRMSRDPQYAEEMRKQAEDKGE